MLYWPFKYRSRIYTGLKLCYYCVPTWRCLAICKRSGGYKHYGDVVMDTIASQIISLTIVYSTVYSGADSGADQRKHQSSASLVFVRGIHRGPVKSPHKRPVTRKMFPFDDVIMVTHVFCLVSLVIMTSNQRHSKWPQITRFMGPTWPSPESCRPQMGPMLAPWIVLSGPAKIWRHFEC